MSVQRPVLVGRDRLGFTLLELMVVLLLMGILTAAVVPTLRGTLEAEILHAQSRRLIGAIDLAYSGAVTLGQPHRLRLNPREQRFFVEARLLGADGHAEFVAIPYSSGSAGVIDSRIAITREPAEGPSESGSRERTPAPEDPSALEVTEPITFYPDGTADAAVLVLQDPQGFRQALRINPVTARVEVRALPRL